MHEFRNIRGWRAWYADNSRYNSRQHTWRDLPDLGCLCVVVYFDEEWAPGRHYRALMNGGECFCVNIDLGLFHQVGLDDWTGQVEYELRDQALVDFPDTTIEDWKMGIAVEDDRFQRAYRQSWDLEDPPQ